MAMYTGEEMAQAYQRGKNEGQAELAQDAIPIVDELCAWVDTNMIGCLEVQERGETLLRKLRTFSEET